MAHHTGKDIFEAYGMSEISTFISSGPTTPLRPGSPGRPQPAGASRRFRARAGKRLWQPAKPA